MIRDLFQKGQQMMLDEAAAEESTKSGKLRGGNTSMINSKGQIIGQCANLTYLRYKGIVVEPVDASRDLMFDAGRRNEDHWAEVLGKSLPEGLTIIREEDIPTKWETTDGTPVTGRPDIVLAEKHIRATQSDGTVVYDVPDTGDIIKYSGEAPRMEVFNKPVVGIELKQASSLWTLRDVVFQKKPKLAHLMQAAHYSWQLGCPFELWYTSRSDFAITGDWPKALFPKAGEPGSEHCTYAFYKLGTINPRTKKPTKSKITEQEYVLGDKTKKVKWAETYINKQGVETTITKSDYLFQCDIVKVNPLVQGYELDLHEGKLYYRDAMVDNSEWYESIVTIEDIKRYYEKITKMEQENVVLPEPKVLSAQGERGNYKLSQYCSLKELCCGKCSGQKLDQWVDKIRSQ